MKSILVILLHVCCFCSGIAQDKISEEMLPDLEWGEGSIMLNDGTEKKGIIKYNDKEGGLVSYDQGTESHSYTPRSLLGFEFFDEQLKRQRVFYTLEFEDDEKVGKRPMFFEVLKDLKTFAVLSKIDPIRIKQIQNQSGAFSNGSVMVVGGGGVTTKIYQDETVYILTSEGEIKPYLRVTRKVVDRRLYDREKMKDKVLDRDILEKYFIEPGYSEMKKFAEENNLEFGIKEDLIAILNHYSEVMGLD